MHFSVFPLRPPFSTPYLFFYYHRLRDCPSQDRSVNKSDVILRFAAVNKQGVTSSMLLCYIVQCSVCYRYSLSCHVTQWWGLFPCISSDRRQTWDAAVAEICWSEGDGVWGGEGGLHRLGEAGTGPSPPWWDYQGTKALPARSSMSQHFTEMAEWGWSTASDLGHPVGLSGEHSQWHTRWVPEKGAEYVYMYMHYIQNRLNVQSHKQMKVCCLGTRTVQRLPTKHITWNAELL